MAARLKVILGHLTDYTATVPVHSAAQSVFMSILYAGTLGSTGHDFTLDSNSADSNKNFAVDLLHRVATVVQSSHDNSSPVFREAYKRALEGAQMIEGFAKDHPVCSLVIALGILYLMAPLFVHWLGFTPKGPALGMLSNEHLG